MIIFQMADGTEARFRDAATAMRFAEEFEDEIL